MSALLMGMVWGIQLDHQEQSVMLALADHAQDDGTQIFPSVERLAWKTGYSKRNVQYVLRRLEDKSLIIAVAHEKGGRGRATEYIMRLDNGTPKPPFVPQKGAKYDTSEDEDSEKRVQSTTQTQKGAKYDTKRVQSTTQRVQSGTQKGAIAVAPQPSYNHHKNHHEETARTREASPQENENESAEPEPETDPSPGSAAPLPSFNEFARQYCKTHGLTSRYSEIHAAYVDAFGVTPERARA